MNINNNWVAIATALVSVLSHIGYVNVYKKVTEEKNEHEEKNYKYFIACSIILYILASIWLIILTSISYFCFGSSLAFSDISQSIIENNHILFGKLGFLIPFVIMTFLYASHIALEPFGVKKFNPPTYLIVFQISIVIILFWESVLNGKIIFTQHFKDIGLVLILSTAVLAWEIYRKGFNKIGISGILIAIFSTIFCASALFIDSEFANQVIKVNINQSNTFTPYLFYELLTFLIPAFIVSIFYLWYFGFKGIKHLKEIFYENKIVFLVSSIFSMFQFVFSVFPLAVTKNKVLPATIIAMTGILSVLINALLNIIQHKKINILDFFIYIIISISIFYTLKTLLIL